MAKIVHYEPGRLKPLDPDTQPASTGVTKVEVVVTPEPKTRKQRQEQNAYRSRKRNESQRTVKRKRERDAYYRAVQADLAAGRITEEQAKERLIKRRKTATSEL